MGLGRLLGSGKHVFCSWSRLFCSLALLWFDCLPNYAGFPIWNTYTVNIETWPAFSSICFFIFVLCILIFSRGGSISYRCGKIWRKCSLIFGEEFNIILTPAKRWLECQSSSREGTNIILKQNSWIVSSYSLEFYILTFDPSNLTPFCGVWSINKFF